MNIKRQYHVVRRLYEEKTKQLPTQLQLISSSLGLSDYQTALMNLGSLIKKELDGQSELELQALYLCRGIHDEMQERAMKIPLPHEDQRYLGENYVGKRIKELEKELGIKPKKPRKPKKEKLIPLPRLRTQSSRPKDSQASSSGLESDVQNNDETVS